MSNSEQNRTGYKYRIGFHQSLTTGVIGFEGNVNYDNAGDTEEHNDYLVNMLKNTEYIFREQGYRVASDIEPKPEKVKNGQSNKEVKG